MSYLPNREKIDKIKNMPFDRLLSSLEEEDKLKILKMPLDKVLPMFNEDEKDKVKQYYRLNSYVNKLNEMSLNEVSSQPYQHLINLINDKMLLAMKDSKFFHPHYKNIKSGKLSMYEFLAYFLEYLGEKRLSKELGLDNPFLMATAVRTASKIIKQHIREV